jgi:hypothetical protein
MSLLAWNFSMSRWQQISFPTTPQGGMWSFTSLTHVFFLPFEQFIMQQMVQFQHSILEHLHHHTFFNMFFDRIFEAHCVRILSCFGPRTDVLFTTRLVFLAFRLFSPIFSMAFCTWLGLPHLSIVRIPWCVCTHPIDPMGVHFLCYFHSNEHIGTHHLCQDCMRCWLPHGMKTITCASFNHI